MKRHGRSHLLQQKSKRQKGLSRTLIVDSTEHKKIKTLLPYI
jgi:ribosomal protein L35